MSVEADVKNFEKIMVGLVGNQISNRGLSAYAKAARDMIVARTRRGYGVQTTGGTQQRLKSLSDIYKDFRRRKSSLLDSTTSPEKSNLTFTGQLLRSLIAETKKGQITIRADRKQRKDGFTNEQIAEFVTEGGRPFLGLTVGELRKLTRLYEVGLSAAIKRQL